MILLCSKLLTKRFNRLIGNVPYPESLQYHLLLSCSLKLNTVQWRIQDFPEGANILFGKIVAGNCMKMKEMGPRKGVFLAPSHRCLRGVV